MVELRGDMKALVFFGERHIRNGLDKIRRLPFECGDANAMLHCLMLLR